ncbi:MAG: YHYH domain-containing protein [Roseibium sp.]
MKKLLLILAVASTSFAPIAETFAHGGGTNSQGCHTNRKTGGYHCH